MHNIKNILKNAFYVDTRTLALFRIYFGIICLMDVLRRYSIIEVFYSDAGINFRRQVTSKYSIKYFTLLDYFHSTAEVQLFFILTAICAIFLIIGFYTRFFQFLTAVGLDSTSVVGSDVWGRQIRTTVLEMESALKELGFIK